MKNYLSESLVWILPHQLNVPKPNKNEMVSAFSISNILLYCTQFFEPYLNHKIGVAMSCILSVQMRVPFLPYKLQQLFQL